MAPYFCVARAAEAEAEVAFFCVARIWESRAHGTLNFFSFFVLGAYGSPALMAPYIFVARTCGGGNHSPCWDGTLVGKVKFGRFTHS